MALDMQKEIATFTWPNGEPFVLRVGINTGPAVAGVIGTSKFIYDLWGDTVNVASRMESHGIAGGIQLTQTTHRRVSRHHRCTKRTVNVKGKGPMPVYVLQSSGNGSKKRRVRRKSVAAPRR
jgi:class 3 adenylate cyclase